MLRSVRFSLAGLLLGALTAVGAKAAVVDEQELHALLVERVDVRKWGTGIVFGIRFSPAGRENSFLKISRRSSSSKSRAAGRRGRWS